MGLVTMAAGCAKVEMKPVVNDGGVSQEDKAKIQQHLDTAGIQGEIATIIDDQAQWIVDVGPPKPPPGKRPPPTIPVTYLVDKASGKVTKTEAN